MENTLYIITRTANRPNYFEECQRSIDSQKIDNLKIHKYVTFDDENDLAHYIENYNDLTIIEVVRTKRQNDSEFPYNLYVNEVLDYIKTKELPGWVIILDDDVRFKSNKSLSCIFNKSLDKDKFYFWKSEIGERVICPPDFSNITKDDLKMSGFTFHTDNSEFMKFTAQKYCEIDIVNEALKHVEYEFIDEIVTFSHECGNGMRNDLVKIILEAQMTPEPSKTISIPLEQKKQGMPKKRCDTDDLYICIKNVANKNVYIFEEDSMVALSQCICNLAEKCSLQSEIIKHLSFDPKKTQETQKQVSIVETTKNIETPTNEDNFYIFTTNNNQKNSSLEKVKKIIGENIQNYGISQLRDSNILTFNNFIRETIKTAKLKGQKIINIINGDSLINSKFWGIYYKQKTLLPKTWNLWFFGNNEEVSARDVATSNFNLEDYLYLYEDIVEARLTTHEKAQSHWKTYGHREGRYASIFLKDISKTGSYQNNVGFSLTESSFDTVLKVIDSQNIKDTKYFYSDLIKSDQKIVLSKPDLFIPSFLNATAVAKNKQISLKNAWYYNFYTK